MYLGYQGFLFNSIKDKYEREMKDIQLTVTGCLRDLSYDENNPTYLNLVDTKTNTEYPVRRLYPKKKKFKIIYEDFNPYTNQHDGRYEGRGDLFEKVMSPHLFTGYYWTAEFKKYSQLDLVEDELGLYKNYAVDITRPKRFPHNELDEGCIVLQHNPEKYSRFKFEVA